MPKVLSGLCWQDQELQRALHPGERTFEKLLDQGLCGRPVVTLALIEESEKACQATAT
jgi:hypothetical protein